VWVTASGRGRRKKGGHWIVLLVRKEKESPNGTVPVRVKGEGGKKDRPCFTITIQTELAIHSNLSIVVLLKGRGKKGYAFHKAWEVKGREKRRRKVWFFDFTVGGRK